MHNKRVALVIGANQGIGFQIVKDLVTHGFTVLVGSRNFERGKAAAKRIRKEFGHFDLLVNNAAISNTRKGNLSLQDYAQILLASNEPRAVQETNGLGVLAVYQAAMSPFLCETPFKRSL